MTGRRLVVAGLHASPGGQPVLRGLDLEVASGRLTSVLGPSGAGKTTLLRVLAGLEPATAGTVRIGGRDITRLPAPRRTVAMVFQEARLFPSMDAGDNVAFPLRLAGVGRAQRRGRAAGVLEAVGLGGFTAREVRGLSGGERQRVALARALAADPDLLLLDEPLAAVDPEQRAALRRLVADLHARRPVTTVHVTHDRVEAAELGDHLAVLLGGTIAQHGTPREVFEEPASPSVARFVGASNLLHGHVAAGVLDTPFGPLDVDGPDGPATVAIRPEHIRLVRDGPLTARVERVVYRAGRQRVELSDGGDHRLTAEIDSDIPVRASASVGFAVPEPWRVPEVAGEAPGVAAVPAPRREEAP